MRASRADVWRAGLAWSNGPDQCRPNWDGLDGAGLDGAGVCRAWSQTELALARMKPR